ncbi:efflux RND transporter periplasmic adaptor subunit [Nitrincola iocasae]|uniref:Efflux RND transporter periplasmic adaptor subunit n=1 Tax=Nitrincola iocasae TaxID=2614693 RepID=A0A5J6LB05_9GAMM|nr:efflux RND transporter periplasmic adaptor subunit [Nitrincola iocasae]QEW05809.1 efflux RND transporter periplasmic adaptor subunit [Nitrincola iocasae]
MAFSSSLIKLRSSHFSLALALLLAALLAIWLLSGSVYSLATDEPEFIPSPQETERPVVEVQQLQASTYHPSFQVQGQLEPYRQSTLTSRINSQVEAWHVRQGQAVNAGDLIISLDQEDRQAQLQRAEADLRVAEANLRATERLTNQNLSSETALLNQQAIVASARAERDRVSMELQHTKIRAPFDGFIESLPIEVGNSVQPGDALASLADTRTLKLTAHIPQQKVSELSEGLVTEARLLDGDQLTGEISFVAHVADSATRSYRIEAQIDNPQLHRVAGASATISILLPSQTAHRFSPALLALDNKGQTGVYLINNEEIMVFMPVQILSLDTSGVWVSGLPPQIDLITQGAGFVSEGEQVKAVPVESD